MCGISGFVSKEILGERVHQDLSTRVKEMTRLQHRRGPDDTGFWSNGSTAAFGHNRLAVLDLSPSGNQPMESENWVLVYNGEIYNYRAIKDALARKGATFKGTGDSETLLFSLEYNGLEETLEKINGIFAFAAYHKSSNTLHLVRDRLGVKPLFYYYDEHEGTVSFASTAAALARTQEDTWELNYDALHAFFLLGAVFSNETLFRGIRRLGPAKHLTFTRGNLSSRVFWRPRPRTGNIAECVNRAIKARSLSDVPVSLFLSGGVDSSVAATVLRDVDAIHLRSPEERYARHIAETFDMPLRIVNPAEFALEDGMTDYVESSGEPAMSAMVPYMICKTVHEAGYKVGISANGADELFCGYPRTPTPGVDESVLRAFHYETPRSRSLSDQVFDIFRHPANFSIPRAPRPLSANELIQPLERECFLEDFPISASYRWLELQTYVLHDLNPVLDFAGMANSVEVRVPFLDYRLVETTLSMTDKELVTPQNGRKAPLKSMLRLAGIQPAMWHRPRGGFRFSSDVLMQLRERSLSALRNLAREGFLQLHCRHGKHLKDFESLLSSAWAFEVWKKVWIDSGLVSTESGRPAARALGGAA